MPVSLEGVESGQGSGFLFELNAAEKKLHAILHDGATYGWRAYFLAADIYIYMALRRIPLGDPTFDYLLDILTTALKCERIFEDVAKYPPQHLFWILLVGGMVADGRVHWSWFQSSLTRCRQILTLETWEDARRILEAISPFGELEPLCRILWMKLS